MPQASVGRIALTRDRDLTHPQQESAHSSWGAKGSHVFGQCSYAGPWCCDGVKVHTLNHAIYA
jgi:hypothetical protein